MKAQRGTSVLSTQFHNSAVFGKDGFPVEDCEYVINPIACDSSIMIGRAQAGCQVSDANTISLGGF
jgi:hypothetical protein